MKFLFIADPLDSFKVYKDTTYAMMQQVQLRGHQIYCCEVADISWQSGSQVQAKTQLIELQTTIKDNLWYQITSHQTNNLSEFTATIMRKDPPFDSEYFYTTHLLQQAQREGASIFNRPDSLYIHPEKLALLEFSQFAPPTLVTRSEQQIRQFYAQYKDIILKPLDGMGGMGIFRVNNSGLNLGSIIETLNQNGSQSVMVQQFLPEIIQGDKRVLLIGGEVVPYSLARIPQNGEVRGNLAVGGKGVAMPLTKSEQQVATSLAPILFERGLYLVGLDMIGGKLTEINVTSPTCFREIMQQTGFDVAAMYIDCIEQAIGDKIT